MSEIKNLTENDIADIFGTGNPVVNVNPAFAGGGDDNIGDLFNPKPTEGKVDPVKTSDKVEEVEEVKENDKPEADLFEEKTDKKEDNTLQISGLSDYYKDRIKNGVFVSIEAEDETGNKTPFIPQTPEEFDEVIQLQVDYKLEQAKKDLEASWYESKSPAWKAVSQYAEIVDDPSQLIPFLQGVKNIQSVSSMNEEDPDQAEAIVRARMEQRGDPEEIIKSQIDALKSTDALIKTAQQVKPLMIQEEQRNLSRQVQEAKAREQEYLKIVTDIRENAHKAIEQPLFGKTKLKQEEKAIIYDLIAVPSEETQGYGIYSVIDKLFDTKDFETLKMIALLATKKDAFFNYLGTDIANQTASKLQKKLTVAAELKGNGGDQSVSDKPVISRNQFSKTPRFGK